MITFPLDVARRRWRHAARTRPATPGLPSVNRVISVPLAIMASPFLLAYLVLFVGAVVPVLAVFWVMTVAFDWIVWGVGALTRALSGRSEVPQTQSIDDSLDATPPLRHVEPIMRWQHYIVEACGGDWFFAHEGAVLGAVFDAGGLVTVEQLRTILRERTMMSDLREIAGWRRPNKRDASKPWIAREGDAFTLTEEGTALARDWKSEHEEGWLNARAIAEARAIKANQTYDHAVALGYES
jgi:hypothetical protein